MDEQNYDKVDLLDQALEDRFFRAMLNYDKMVELVVGAIEPQHFSTQVKARLFKTIIWHFKEFDKLPTRDILLFELSEMHGSRAAKQVELYIKKIESIPVPEWDWIIKQIDKWVQGLALHKAMFTSAEILKRGQVKEAQGHILDTIRHSSILQVGGGNVLDIDADQVLDIVEEENSFCCPTRIYALDYIIQGLFRQEFFVIMSPLNVGKSWSAIHMSNAALLSGKHVLHITCEMNRKRVLQRQLQNMTGTVRPRGNATKQQVEIWTEDFENKEVVVRDSMVNIKELTRQLDIYRKFGGGLQVKEYPSGVCTAQDVEREILIFDAQFRKLPDVVIVDALSDLDVGASTDTRKLRGGLTTACKELRRMAGEYNCALVATHQANREALKVELVESQHTGEALAIMQIADTAISLNQTKAEYEQGLMRAYIMRARNVRKWKQIQMFQNLDLGQFCQVSRLVEDEESDNEVTPRNQRGQRPTRESIRSRLSRQTNGK